MAITLDDKTFRRMLDLVMPGANPTRAEAGAILDIAQLAAGIDLDDDAAEHGLLGALTRLLCAAAGVPRASVRPLSPLPIDDEERSAMLAGLVRELPTAAPRELAYMVAYLLIAADLELAPVEGEMLGSLQRALGLTHARAAELAAEVSALVTPGVDDLDAYPGATG